MDDELSGLQQRLLFEALVTFSDACTLPSLTPECPFYRVDNGFPTCSNECVDLINSWGGERRPIGDARIDGLILTGRKLPLSAAGPAHPYDATRMYLEQRSRPVADQATGSLIIGLGAALNQVPWDQTGSEQFMRVNSLWAELERRKVPVESLVRAAIIPQVATQIGILAVMPLLREDALFDELASTDELMRLDERAHGWSEVLQQTFDRDGGATGVRTQIDNWFDGRQTIRNLSDIFRLEPTNSSDFADESGPPAPTNKLLMDMRLPYALSTQFTGRVTQWLNRLLSDDLAGVVSWQAPPPAVFMALPAMPMRDETGLWIWDRFAHTSLEDWELSSLLREWGGNEDGALDPRVWAERTFDLDQLARTALTRLAKPTRPRPAPQLSADAFVNVAIRHLELGENDEAAHIFEGLVSLRPTDGDALNNLGFCLLRINPAEALAVLQRSSLFPLKQQTINAANRVMALLLVGRAVEALELARESKRIPPSPYEAQHCYSWTIGTDAAELRLQSGVSPGQYLSELIDYLEAMSD